MQNQTRKIKKSKNKKPDLLGFKSKKDPSSSFSKQPNKKDQKIKARSTGFQTKNGRQFKILTSVQFNIPNKQR